jgi:hypothetical protein
VPSFKLNTIISGEHDTVQIRSGSFARRSRLQRVTWSAGAVNLDNPSWFLRDYAPLLPGWYWSAAHDILCFQQIFSLSLVLVSAPKLCSPSQWRRTVLAAHPDVQIIGFSFFKPELLRYSSNTNTHPTIRTQRIPNAHARYSNYTHHTSFWRSTKSNGASQITGHVTVPLCLHMYVQDLQDYF